MTNEGAWILLVDDNVNLSENLKEILSDSGYEVVCVADGAGALKAASTPFHLALVDIRLPDLSGTDLATALKGLQTDFEVVLLTGFATVETAAAAVRAGAFAYLLKPCSTRELLLTVEQALRQVQLKQEKRALTQRAHLAEKLALVGTMTAGLSHEIRNPLNAALLQLAVAERRAERVEAAPLKHSLLEPIRLVRDEIRRLDHILEDFLQFARPRELRTTRFDLSGLVNRVLDLLQGEAERRQVAVFRQLPDVGTLLADETQLRQVVMNLVLNALQAADAHGRVRIETKSQENEVWLMVDDSGPGLKPHARSHLFEPFFTTKASGSGLGLAMVHSIVTQHGGKIEVHTSPLNGARFVVTLPRSQA